MNTAVEVRAAAEPLALLETLVHELRQPLSAIESTAYYLTMVLPRTERRAQDHAACLQRLVGQANWILSSGLQLADASPMRPEPLDLGELITQTVASQIAERGGPPRLDLASGLPPVRLDPGRARFLVEHLLAMVGRVSDAAHAVRVRTSRGASPELGTALELILELAANTRGQGPEDCFGAGASMGIECARRIVEAHGGTFHIEFEPGQIEFDAATVELDAGCSVRVHILFPENVVLP
jgi:light-regulated signal transduction histidine kinase (bacteriophytochrome)